MKRNKILVTFFAFSYSCFAESGVNKIDQQMQSVMQKIELLNSTINVLKTDNENLKTAFSQYQGVNSNISNLLTTISIILALIAIFLPIINYFFVLKPNRRVQKRIRTLEKEIPERIDSNFENYISNYEIRRMDKSISGFINQNDYKLLANTIFTTDSIAINENQCSLIISKIKNGIEMEKTQEDIIIQALFISEYPVCDRYFREILEDDENTKYKEYAIRYFATKNIADDIKYLEKVLTSREDFEALLVELVHAMEREYLGNPFTDKKPKESIDIGEDRIKLLLNSKRIVEIFNPAKLVDEFTVFAPFLDNDNVVNFHPFYKETYMYKKHYEEYYRDREKT